MVKLNAGRPGRSALHPEKLLSFPVGFSLLEALANTAHVTKHNPCSNKVGG